ncbi:MAG: GxxExxY protein [Pirellulales bacterium]
MTQRDAERENEERKASLRVSVPSADNQGDPQTYAIIGACMAVHNALGQGFLEAVHQEALAIELAALRIPFTRERRLPITYRGEILSVHYCADFVCYESVIVELKALSALNTVHTAQVINYLKATRIERGLLINFGAPKLQYERLILSRDCAERPTEP